MSTSVSVSPAWVPAISGGLAVAFGAFGSHALKGKITPELMKTWETAVQYHLAHSVVLLGVHALEKVAAVTAQTTESKVHVESRMSTPTKLFFFGVLLFSGSLYALVLSGIKKLGAITPIGGISLITGWLSLIW